jgi:peptidoglycan/LPS O-acetylase OafA/YrhL
MRTRRIFKWRRGARGPGRSLHEKIDLCRGLFALLVVTAHALELAWLIAPDAPGTLPPWARRALTDVAGCGIYYVMGFFVLSGYCIQLSVERLRGDGGEAFPLRAYLAARLTRILPLYYLGLLAAAAAERAVAGYRAPIWPNGLGPSAFLCQLAVVQNFSQTYGCFAPSWSITNEVVYYLLFGVLAALWAGNRTRPATAGAASCLGVAVLCELAYRSGYRHPLLRDAGMLFGLGIVWFAGVALALAADLLASIAPLRAASRAWPLILAAAMGLWCSRRVHLGFACLAAGLAFALMLARFVIDEADRGAEDGARPGGRLAAVLGLASYPTYLFHGPILLVLGSILQGTPLGRTWWLCWPLTATVAAAAGVALGFFAERPIMAWRAGCLRRLARAGGSAGRSPVPAAAILRAQ